MGKDDTFDGLTTIEDNTVVQDPLGISQKSLGAAILLLLDILEMTKNLYYELFVAQ